MAVPTIQIKSWNQIHHFGRPGWIYRGQRSAAWELGTSLERTCDRNGVQPNKRHDLELELLRDFRRGYHQYARHVPASDSKIEWLSLMQHHGAPTRLLDFTYSIYVAAYFALETADDASAVWAVNNDWVHRESVGALEKAGMKDARRLMQPLPDEYSEKLDFELVFGCRTVKAVAPLNPFRLNERLRIQKGVFLVPTDLSVAFKENLNALPGSSEESNVMKLVLERDLRVEAIERLFYMNVSRTSLFPGLDGYAESLGIFHHLYKDLA